MLRYFIYFYLVLNLFLKIIISISLLICLIVPFAGTVSWLHFHKRSIRKQIKHEIIAGIEKEELVQLTFTIEETRAQLKWKHSKEFEYNLQMYDIVEADTTKNIITYWCWWDHQETKLNKQLNKLLAQFLGNDMKNKETKNRFASFYQTLFHNKSICWEAMVFEKDNTQNSSYLFNNSSFHIEPFTPPPNLV